MPGLPPEREGPPRNLATAKKRRNGNPLKRLASERRKIKKVKVPKPLINSLPLTLSRSAN